MLKGLRVTCALMLWISINLLSMHDFKLNRKLAYSRNAKQEEKKYKDVLLNSPSSVPYFKQQSIVLQNNNANQYSLIFNRQQPCITQYLLEGNPVAKLIQIDDEINFESNGSRVCNFSLQIPYQVGSLTINTQGRFIFEKKINAYSAYLRCKAVDFREGFSSNNGLIVEADSCRNQAQLTCSDFLFKGKEFETVSKSFLNAHNSLTLMAQSLVLNQGTVDSWKESFIQSSLFKNSGSFTSDNMHFDGNEVINLGALIIGDTFHCASKLFDHRGILDVFHNCIMEKGDIFSSTSSSVWNVNGDWKAFINSLSLNGSFNVKNLYVVGKNFTAEQPLHCIAENAHLKIEEDVTNAGVIKILGLLDVDSKNITLEKTSCIKTDNADLKASQAIHNEGTVSVKRHLSAHSHYISNAGKIKTNSSNIKADRYYYNKIFSTLSAKNNLTINTPIYFNLLGLTDAQGLMINSAIGLNALGIYAAKNMAINSLISLNAGLFLPKFGAFSEIYSQANLWGLGESLFISYVPFYGSIYAALKSIKGTYHQARAFCDEICSLRKQKGIGLSDKISLICSIKNMVSSARQTFQLGTQSYHLLSDSPQLDNPQAPKVSSDDVIKSSDSLPADNMQSLESSSDVVARVKDIAQQAVLALASYHAPSVTISSIIDHNYGVAMGINNHSTSLYNRNSNFSIYLQNTIDTRYGKNTGYLGAYNLNINATSSYGSDGNIRASNLTLQGKGSANIQGDVTANKIAIKSDRLITINSHVTSPDVHLYAKYINQYGMIAAQQVVMNGDRISNYGTVKAPQIIIIKANLPGTSWFDSRDPYYFHNEGSLQASDQLFVDAGNIELHKKSEVNAPNVYLKSDGNWKNDGNITAEQLALNVKRDVTNSGFLQASKIIINSGNPDRIAWAFRNTGSIQASDQLFVEAANIQLDKRSEVNAPNVYLKSDDDWKNDGNITAEQLVLDVKKNGINNGFLQAPKIIITQGKSDDNGWRAHSRAFRNTGSIHASDQLFVDAKNIHLHEKSDVDTPSAYFKTNGDWQNDGKLKTEQCVIDSKGKAVNTNDISAEQLLYVKAENILFDSKSNVKSKDACYKADKNVFIGGVMDVERGSVDAGGKVRAIGKIGASNQLDIKAKDIVIEKTSHVSTPKTYLRATETIDSRGKLSTSDLFAHAKYVQNSGEIISDDKAHIKADRYFWNGFGGSINVENVLAIDAFILLNVLGCISADSICTNSIIDANLLGIYRGNNICQNSFISYNRGLLIPKSKFLDDLTKLYKKNPLRFVESFALQFVPKLGKFYSLLKSIAMCLSEIGGEEEGEKEGEEAGFLNQAKALWFSKEARKAGLLNRAKALRKHINDLSEKQDLCVSDVVSALCQTKSILASAVQTGCQIVAGGQQAYQGRQQIYEGAQQVYEDGKQAYRTAQDYLQGQSDIVENFTLEQNASNNNTTPIFPTAMSFVGSQMSTAVSTVMSIAGSQLSRNSLLDVNNGLMLGVNGDSQSLYNMNGGISVFVSNNSVTTISGANTGFISGGNVSVNAAQTYSSTGVVGGINTSMVANDLNVNGPVGALNNINLSARNKANIDADIIARNVNIQGNEVALKKDITINAHGGTAKVIGNTIVSESTVKGNAVCMAANFITLQDGSDINAGNVGIKAKEHLELQKESSINAQGGTANIEAQTIASASDIQGNAVNMKAELISLQDGSDIRTQGGDNTVAIKANELQLETGSTIKGGVVGIDAVSLQGDAGNSIVSTEQTNIKTANLDNQGSVSGVLAVDFTGDSTQLKSIGQVDHLQYSGTLENNLADTLAQGKNNIIHVNSSGSVTILAGKQDVHLKDEHKMDHVLNVKTDGAIKCDKKLTSSKSMGLEAKNNLDHKSINVRDKVSLAGKNIIATSTVNRIHNGKNYEDHIDPITITSNGIEVDATENVFYEGVKTHSGKDGTIITADGKNVNTAVMCQKHTESDSFNKKKHETTTTKDTFTTAHVCEHTSDGIVTMQAGDTVDLQGTTFDSKGGAPVIDGKNGVNSHDVYNIHEHELKYKRAGGCFRSEKHNQLKSISTIAKTVDFKGDKAPEISSDVKISLSFTSDSSRIILNAPSVELHLAQNTLSSHSERDSASIFWESEKLHIQQDVTYSSSFKGTIETNAENFYIEEVKGFAPIILNSINNNMQLSRNVLDEIHTNKNPSFSRPTRATTLVLAMAVAMATSGFGSSLGATMVATIGCKSAISATVVTNATAAAITSLSVQAADALLRCNGDYSAAAKTIASTDTLKNIVLAAATSGAMAGAGELLNQVGLPAVQDAHNLGERLMYAAPRQAVNGIIKTGANVIAGQELKDAAMQNMRSALAGTIGVACTSQIGDAYAKEQIDPISHKVLHTGVGALEGAIFDGFNGAVAGGMSALVAETVADLFTPEMPSLSSIKALEAQIGRPLTQQEFTQTWNDQISSYWQGVSSTGDISKLAAVSCALLTHQDVDIANTISATAIDNNFLILAGYGLVTAGVAYSAYKINNAYQEDGAQGAFKQLGIEVVTQVVAFGAVKVGFKVGCVMYPSAKVAVAAALESMPGLKSALGELAEVIAVAGEKIGESVLGKGVSVVENHLVNATNKITQKIGESALGKGISTVEAHLGNVKNTVAQKLGDLGANLEANLVEGLVDHVVPSSVISKMEAQVGKQVVEKVETTIVQKLGNLTKPDFVMITPEGVKISVPDTHGEAGLLQRADDIGEPVNKVAKASLASNIESQSASHATKNAAKAKDVAKVEITTKVETKSVVPSEPLVKAENVGVIKGDLLSKIKKYEEHIFSDDHKKRGILALGKNQEIIMDSLHDVITSLDKNGFIKEGSNQLRVKINGIDNIEVRCFIKNGEAISINAFISDFGRIFDNFIDTTKVLK